MGFGKLSKMLQILGKRSILYNCKQFSVASSQWRCQKRYLQAPKRFYKNVTITQSNGLYEINLDKSKLKTPLGKVLQVPNEPLAVAVATEWDAQKKNIHLQSMHLTGLCNTSLDNPTKKTKEILAENIIAFLATDTICFRQDEPPELAELLTQEWEPVLQWFCKRYDVNVTSTSSISAPPIFPETKVNLTRHLLSYDFWTLTGLQYAVEALKSVILTLVTVDRFLTVEKAVALSQLELEYQVSHWGNVEWAHDMERLDLRARVAAAILFTHLISQSTQLSSKSNVKR